MDRLSLAGIALALAGIVGGQALEGGTIGSLLQLAAFCIVLGGTAGAVMLQSPVKTFVAGMRLLRWVVTPPQRDLARATAQIVEWANVARRDGLLALESQLTVTAEPFTRSGLQMLVDGFEADSIRHALEVEMNAWEERHHRAAGVWEAAGGYAPTIGILGAVLGLIHVMENLADPAKLGGGIAVAFVATVYGVGLANLVFLPIAGKLRAIIEAEVQFRALVMDGLLGISGGENPQVIAARLAGYAA